MGKGGGLLDRRACAFLGGTFEMRSGSKSQTARECHEAFLLNRQKSGALLPLFQCFTSRSSFCSSSQAFPVGAMSREAAESPSGDDRLARLDRVIAQLQRQTVSMMSPATVRSVHECAEGARGTRIRPLTHWDWDACVHAIQTHTHTHTHRPAPPVQISPRQAPAQTSRSSGRRPCVGRSRTCDAAWPHCSPSPPPTRSPICRPSALG